ncbi:MAG: glycosyltransferase [Bacteroidetes bacterium]|nr:glycosyltransferase [Bacteroidota bacterium]
MQKRNLLFVSIAFPPKNDPECLQTARYFRYLSTDPSWVIDVATSASPTLFMPFDESLLKYDSGYRQKVEIKLGESKLTSFALVKLKLARILFPDSKMTFHWQWRKVVRRLKQKPDIIYSRSNPMSSAFMAYKLSEHYKCPWVLHLSDPWVLSPLKALSEEERRRYTPIEKRLLQRANAVTFTTVQTLDLYARAYPELAAKFAVLPNVYDPEDISPPVWNTSDKLRIVYTGGLSGKRNVFFLKEVLEKVRATDSQLLERVEFIFAGDMDRPNRQFFSEQQKPITHIGQVSYSKVKELCSTAQILLVVDNPTAKEEAIFFPSKLLDYFLMQRKIWAVTPQESATRGILEGYNHAAFDHSEIDAMSSFLIESIRHYNAEGNEPFKSLEVPSAFDAKTSAHSLAALLTRIAT